MRTHTSWSSYLAAFAIGLSGITGTDRRQPAHDPSDPGRPRAHFLALHDFGTPAASKGTATEEPIWFKEDARLVEGPDQDIYSTSPSGGKYGKGVVFKISPKGQLTVLYPFTGSPNDAAAPHSGLVDGRDTYLYGTSYGGGHLGVGAIYRIKIGSKKAELLYSFRNGDMRNIVKPCPKPYRCDWSPRQKVDAAGSYPLTPLVLGPNKTFYGVTWYSWNQQFGTLYSLAPPYDSTGFKTLCLFDPRKLQDKDFGSFVCDPEIHIPTSLVVGDNGTLYGTTAFGYGAVFSAPLGGGRVTVLHKFNLSDGSHPTSLMQASDHRLYGTTSGGGDRGVGVVYRLDPASKAFDVMSSFRIGKFLAGAVPFATLVEGKDAQGNSDGFLYGTTKGGGAEGRGTVFKIKRDGDSLDLHVLHDFSLYATGRYAIGPVLQHSDGSFYGVTSQGGLRDAGVFYRLSDVDLPEQTTHAGSFAPLARNAMQQKEQRAVPLDKLVSVRVHAYGTQPPGLMTPVPHKTDDGVSIVVGCRNPHFVQFIYREEIVNGQHVSRTVTSGSGSYPLTTDPAKQKFWHSDSNGKPDAFYDQGTGAGWSRYTSRETTWLTMFDQPNYTHFEDALSVQQADPTTYRATFKTYAICNGDVVREVQWVMEVSKGVRSYKNVKILLADNSALPWINTQLKSDGFRPVP